MYTIKLSANIDPRLTLKFLACWTLFVLATIAYGADSLTDESPAFHFQLKGNTTKPHCVATQLLPPRVENVPKPKAIAQDSLQVIHALTAAHCFDNSVESIHISCRDSSLKQTLVTSFSFHPTHDAVYMELLVEDSCLGKGVSSRRQELGKQHQYQQLHIPALVRPTGDVFETALRSSGPNRVATILSVDQETLRLDDQVACLRAGDSGYPLLLDGKLAALLISGLDGCPTEQIGIRIDRIAAWISSHWEN